MILTKFPFLKSLLKSEATCFISQFCTGLPKTRSGKIMRRILRKVAADHEDEFGDISTLAEPAIVEEIIRNHKNIKNLDWKTALALDLWLGLLV